MIYETFDELYQDKQDLIDKKDISLILKNKLKELYKKQKSIPLFDYSEIKYSAMIDLIYEVMPSLREEIE